jgi:hypothetical protein
MFHIHSVLDAPGIRLDEPSVRVKLNPRKVVLESDDDDDSVDAMEQENGNDFTVNESDSEVASEDGDGNGSSREKRVAETDSSTMGEISNWESTKKRVVADFVVLEKDEKGKPKFVRKAKAAVPIYKDPLATSTLQATSPKSSAVDPWTEDDDLADL